MKRQAILSLKRFKEWKKKCSIDFLEANKRSINSIERQLENELINIITKI